MVLGRYRGTDLTVGIVANQMRQTFVVTAMKGSLWYE